MFDITCYDGYDVKYKHIKHFNTNSHYVRLAAILSQKGPFMRFHAGKCIIAERAGSVLCAASGTYIRHYIWRSDGSNDYASVLRLLWNRRSCAFFRQNQHLSYAKKQQAHAIFIWRLALCENQWSIEKSRTMSGSCRRKAGSGLPTRFINPQSKSSFHSARVIELTIVYLSWPDPDEPEPKRIG